MGNVTGTQVESVIASYAKNNSILETAKDTGISTVKVRKILITEGLWESDTSLKIGDLLKHGMTTEEKFMGIIRVILGHRLEFLLINLTERLMAVCIQSADCIWIQPINMQVYLV